MPYQMSSGKWRAKRMIHGKVRTKVFPTKHEAKKWEATQDAQTWQDENSTIRLVCLHDFANIYLGMAKERFAKSTFNEKKLAFKRLYATIPPTTPIENITPAMAMDALRAMVLISSGNAANVARKNLMTAWEWGKQYYGLDTVNPFAGTNKFPANRKPRYVPPEKDFWKAYDAAEPHDQVFLLTMLHTGARRAELFRLTWDDIDFQGRKIRLGTRKTGHGGMEYDWVSMTNDAYNALATHKMQSESQFVFTDPTSGEQYLSRQHYMERLCKRAGVKPFGFHAIRHLTATILAYEGLDIPSVQAQLRHRNPNTTARYIKSLGVQPDKLSGIFDKRKPASKVVSFKAGKKGFGT